LQNPLPKMLSMVQEQHKNVTVNELGLVYVSYAGADSWLGEKGL